ncbi:MAG: TolC family protein [Candidatus Nitrohelix vancouverensis]|uniref:TolC family protein n=1 Tax=Candidatus Nitrohelix vancouverensis TaxID=2705534 RepID=A0A7T0C0C5_9BACT|nr:MAG: TolC family protein [Candidatus Nitrohelix vancouverensis]
MKRFMISWGVVSLLSLAALTCAQAETIAPPQFTDVKVDSLLLEDAIAQALARNPDLAVFSLEKQALGARTLQSSLLPNPRLAIDVDDAMGSGSFSGFDRSETTIRLEQRIELGGKRDARRHAGQMAESLAEWSYTGKRLDVLADVHKAFAETLKSQHKIELAQEQIELGEQFYNAVNEKVKAGQAPTIEIIKAQVALANYGIELKREEIELDKARRELARVCGADKPNFNQALGDLHRIEPVPPKEPLKQRLLITPHLAFWESEEKRQQAMVDVELSKTIPDLSVSGGFRRVEETDDSAVVFGFSIPLQLFDRNQGGVAEARIRYAQAGERRKAAELQVYQTFQEAYQSLYYAHSFASALQVKILPAAQKAFDAISEGYKYGKFGLLDVLDSQRTLFDTKAQYLDAVAEYHKASAELKHLTDSFTISSDELGKESVEETSK